MRELCLSILLERIHPKSSKHFQDDYRSSENRSCVTDIVCFRNLWRCLSFSFFNLSNTIGKKQISNSATTRFLCIPLNTILPLLYVNNNGGSIQVSISIMSTSKLWCILNLSQIKSNFSTGDSGTKHKWYCFLCVHTRQVSWRHHSVQQLKFQYHFYIVSGGNWMLISSLFTPIHGITVELFLHIVC